MCHQIKTIAKNCNGQLSFCEECKIYHLTFNNIYLELRKQDMLSFQKYVSEIDVEYWETKYDSMPIKRKVVINTLHSGLSMLFNRSELDSFKDLLSENTKKVNDSLTVLDIDYTLFLN
tara:strand:+ start:310 stop:663 length:354 start_codon:yes stop_codon:yes gene_type:complete